MAVNPNQYLETAMEIARAAGAVLSDFARKGIGFELKGEFDLVTEADRTSERLIIERLKAAFPGHDIIAEEGGGHVHGSEYRWYVDPLDGTTNFAHGFPVYNVTLALEKNNEIIAGVVYDPTRDELFAAERGAGAFLNGAPIRVSKAARLEDSLLATGFPSRRRHIEVNVHFYYQLAMLSHGVRRAGSAAIDLAYVAAGRLDGFWEFGLKPWDQAAGYILVSEAGGRVSDMAGLSPQLTAPHVMATNGLLHEEILSVFDGVFRSDVAFPIVQISPEDRG